MQAPHRPSILQRAVRPQGGKANEERCEAEFQAEKQRLQAKAQRLQNHEERLVGAFYPDNSEFQRRAAWSQAQREAEALAAAKAAVGAAERERERQWLAQPQRVVVDTERPWTATSSTYFMPPEVEDAARRRAQREASDANRCIAQRRTMAEAAHKAAEQKALRHTMLAEDTWFNRGAASERWIPPERRIKQRAAVPPQFAPAPPPYCCYAEEPSSTSTYSAPANPSRRRAVEGQGVAAALRHDAAPVAGSAASFSGGYGAAAPGQGAGAAARPQTAPGGRQQERQYPWSWQT